MEIKPLIPIKKLESTPEIDKVREAYKALRKNLKDKGINVPGIRIMKRKGVYGIKIALTDEKNANQVPAFQDTIPIHKIEIVKPPAPIPGISTPHVYKGKTFTIETVKWSWPFSVQSKGVYRDDEFVRTKTKDEALEAVGFLLSKPRGLTNAVTVFRDNEYFTYYRHSMPCLGGLVKYRDSHGEKHFMNPYFPRDIRVAFPEGDIVYIGAYRQNLTASLKTPYYEFIFSQESPWIAAFGTRDTIIFKDHYFVLTNMDTDPTVFYSLMRLGGLAYYGNYNIYGAPKMGANLNPKAEILLTKTAQADPRRLAGQKPLKISGGTWAEGYGYTRPYNESIFKTSLPTKLKDFGELGAYPQAPYTNQYFISEMKKIFGVDVAKVNDTKMHEALVKAWDYFKEKSNELSEKA